jgi:hypothetical protein
MCIDLKLVDKDNCSKAFLSRVFIQVRTTTYVRIARSHGRVRP